MPARLFTFGYQGLSLAAFIARLRQAGVETVLDVRETPWSRKPGFSKRALAQALARSGIAYTHLPALGCPKPIRARHQADGDWAAYTKAFNEYLAGQQAAIAELVGIAQKTAGCLLCFEADFNSCHRSLVASAAALAGGLDVAHLSAGSQDSRQAELRLV